MASGAVEMLNGEILVDASTAPSSGVTHEETRSANGSVPQEPINCDVLVIGAGLSGITAIHRFRKLGMNVKCFESGTDFGGVWYWNRYPGARVDSEAPFYQLAIPEVWRDWHFSQRFSDHVELRRYMAHCDKVLNLRKDTYFNARVNDARWDDSNGRWIVKTLQGHVANAKYLISCTGLLHRTYTPDFQGLSDFKGELYHSGAWPEGYSAKGKKVAIIGAGATAVQITQELGKEADELTVFLRRPSYCLPMRNRTWTEEEQRAWKAFYPALFATGRDSRAGFPGAGPPCRVQDVSETERLRLWEELWARGSFNFALCNYNDIGTDKEANKMAYHFWRNKVLERLTDPAKGAIMAPENPPYYFGTKRSPLENDYYEVLNQPNVHIHNLSKVPLKCFSEKGLVMADDSLHEFDTIVLATGFDSYSGSLTQMGLKNTDGVDLKDLWKDGIKTYLGITISGFPNCFICYSPMAPTALSNGPTIIECQIETIASIVEKAEAEKAKKVEAQRKAEEEWKQICATTAGYTLIPHTDSWWNGANIPGKKAETLIYVLGINTYEKQMRERIENWHGFEVVSAAA